LIPLPERMHLSDFSVALLAEVHASQAPVPWSEQLHPLASHPKFAAALHSWPQWTKSRQL